MVWTAWMDRMVQKGQGWDIGTDSIGSWDKRGEGKRELPLLSSALRGLRSICVIVANNNNTIHTNMNCNMVQYITNSMYDMTEM